MHRKRCRNQSRSSSSSRAISVIVTRSCGHIFLPRRACAAPAWSRLRHAGMAAPARRPRRLRECAAARATLLLQPSHARACAYGSQLPTSTSNFGFANCYILYSVPTIYKISFRFQDIGLGYIYINVLYVMYIHMNIHRQAKKQQNMFWQLLGDCTYVISFSH